MVHAGLANYIDTFKQNELEKAKEHYRILSNALSCTKGTDRNMRYVLDMYAYIQDKDLVGQKHLLFTTTKIQVKCGRKSKVLI